MATVAAATFVAGGTATAYAQDGDNCDPGEFCLYENHRFNEGNYSTYGKRQWEESDLDYTNDKWWDYINTGHHKTDVLNDEASSLKNRSGCVVVLYQDTGHSGDRVALGLGVELVALDGLVVGDNQASSHKFVC